MALLHFPPETSTVGYFVYERCILCPAYCLEPFHQIPTQVNVLHELSFPHYIYVTRIIFIIFIIVL